MPPRIGISIDTARVTQVIDPLRDRTADRVRTFAATGRIDELPPPAGGRRKQSAFEEQALLGRQRPRMFLSYDGFVSGIEAAPDQSQIALIVVEKTLVCKPGMKGIRLIEIVPMSAGRALDSDHTVLYHTEHPARRTEPIHQIIATARIGPAVPPRLFNGKPMNLKRPCSPPDRGSSAPRRG